MKKYHLVLGFALVFALTITTVFMSSLAVAPAPAGSLSDDNENVVATVPADNAKTEDIEKISSDSGVILEIGDIICVSGNDTLADLIPGRYDHTQIYIGNGQVIEGHGVGEELGIHYGTPKEGGDVYRVQTSSAVKQAVVEWTIDKVGLPYNYWLFSKRLIANSYYCSELHWAAYLLCGGPDIDQNPGWSWTYFNAVAPTEVADDDDTVYVGTIGKPTLEIGDIICVKGDGLLGALIPGRYDHTQIYIGNGQVIEGHGVGEELGIHYGTPKEGGDVFRVTTSASVKQAVVDWTITKVGLPYNYWLFSKRLIANSYYCSELHWAAYLLCGGPDIDQNPGWSWTYFNAVAPTEVADDDNTYYVGTL